MSPNVRPASSLVVRRRDRTGRRPDVDRERSAAARAASWAWVREGGGAPPPSPPPSSSALTPERREAMPPPRAAWSRRASRRTAPISGGRVEDGAGGGVAAVWEKGRERNEECEARGGRGEDLEGGPRPPSPSVFLLSAARRAQPSPHPAHALLPSLHHPLTPTRGQVLDPVLAGQAAQAGAAGGVALSSQGGGRTCRGRVRGGGGGLGVDGVDQASERDQVGQGQKEGGGAGWRRRRRRHWDDREHELKKKKWLAVVWCGVCAGDIFLLLFTCRPRP